MTVRFYKIRWPVSDESEQCQDWATSQRVALKIARSIHDDAVIIPVDVPTTKPHKEAMLAFLKKELWR